MESEIDPQSSRGHGATHVVAVGSLQKVKPTVVLSWAVSVWT